MIPPHALPTIEALPRLPRMVALALYALADEWGEVTCATRRARALLDVLTREVNAGIDALVEAGLAKDERHESARTVTLLEWQGTPTASPRALARLRVARASVPGARLVASAIPPHASAGSVPGPGSVTEQGRGPLTQRGGR